MAGATLRYPDWQEEAELDQAGFDAADALIRSGAALQNLLTLNNLVSGTVTDQALGTLSYSARTSPIANRASAEGSRRWIEQRLGQVEVSAPRAVTLSSTSGRFQATVTNTLDEPVTVALDALSDDRLSIEGPARVEVPANGRQAVLLTARTNENGIHEVTLLVTDKRGTPLGAEHRPDHPLGPGEQRDLGVRRHRRRAALRSHRRPAVPADPQRPAYAGRDRGRTGRQRRAQRAEGTRRSRHPVTDRSPSTRPRSSPALLSNSAVMAAGTTVSRLSGFVRAALLSYALGASVHADVFNVANSLPNMLYILLAGGVFNAVLVPQLVRSMRSDPDRGDAYTSRVVTVAGLFLVVVTVLLVVAAPLVVDLVTSGVRRRDPRLRDRVHPLLPAAGLLLRDVRPGRADPQRPRLLRPDDVGADRQQRDRRRGGAGLHRRLRQGRGRRGLRPLHLRPGGCCSASARPLGIAVQLLILVPYLRRAGFRYRPRLDLRGSGLGHTFRLGMWTVLFVVVNQIAYVVVQQLATGGAIGSADGTGFTVYSFSFLVVMVPHSIVTVSLATAMLTRLSAHAAADDRPALAGALSGTLRVRARGDRAVRRRCCR